MHKLLKQIKALLAKGFASQSEKAEVAKLLKELATEEQEVVQEDVDKVDALPEADPTKGNDEEELAKSVKDLVSSAIKSETAKLRAEFEEEVKTFLKEQAELKEKKAGIFNPEIEEKRSGLTKKLRKTMRALASEDPAAIHEMIATKELSTDDSQSPFGGYVVDRELSAEIRHLITEYGVSRREMTAIQLSKGSYTANDLATDISVYWVDEGVAIGSSQVVLGKEDLVLKKLAVIATLTNELITDEEIDLFSFIAGRVAEAFAREEDEAFFTGTGALDTTHGKFTGLLAATDGNSVSLPDNSGESGTDGTAFSHLTADDLLNMQDASPQVVARNGKYYMHRSIMNLVRKLKDDQGMPIFQAVSTGGPNTIWGRPVVEVEVMPSTSDTAADTPFVIYGDLRRACILGFKGSIAAKRFDSGVVRNVAGDGDINLITTDREAIRWTERVGYIRIIPAAVTLLKTQAGS